MKFIKLQQGEIDELKEIYSDVDAYNANVNKKKKRLILLKKLDFLLPFVLTTSFAFAGNILSNKNPFVLEEEKVCFKKCDIQREGELVSTQSSLDSFLLPDESVEFSTAFRLNEDGLYERQFTVFNTEALSKYTKDELYEMTRKELEQAVSIKKKGSIKKKKLDEDDLMYTVDGLYLTMIYDDVDDYIYQQESFWKNLLEILVILLRGGGFGLGIYAVKKVIFKDYIKVKLDNQISSLKIVSVTDLDRIKVMVKIRENNLRLFEEDDNG